jgi:hypothetical protein
VISFRNEQRGGGSGGGVVGVTLFFIIDGAKERERERE